MWQWMLIYYHSDYRNIRDYFPVLNNTLTKKQQIIGLISVLAVGAGVYFSRCETTNGYTLWNPLFGGSEVTCPYQG